jgi:tripartite-type tricarboxylate transporter receptor subunit TctC
MTDCFEFNRRQALLALLSLAAPAARAQSDWPNRPVRIVVGFGAGSTPDILLRVLATELGKRLGQSVVVENRPGATGNIAAEAVARSAPDGYTLFYGTNTTHAINPSLYPRLSYDHIKDFQPITVTGKVWNVLVVNPRSLVTDLRTLVAIARTRPGQLSFASGGNGTSLHLTGELIKQRLGLDILHIPYKTGDQAFTDVAGGRVDMMFANIPSSMPHIQSGRLKAVAVTSRTRSPLLPDVPTLHELGVSEFEVFGWGGLFAPARTPHPVVERLHRDMLAVLTDPTVVQRLDAIGIVAQHSSPSEFARFVQAETQRWKEVVRISGARMD